ncbi:hypothetical protein DL89DRAFT_313062, partial [Linderina pennispora]
MHKQHISNHLLHARRIGNIAWSGKVLVTSCIISVRSSWSRWYFCHGTVFVQRQRVHPLPVDIFPFCRQFAWVDYVFGPQLRCSFAARGPLPLSTPVGTRQRQSSLLAVCQDRHATARTAKGVGSSRVTCGGSRLTATSAASGLPSPLSACPFGPKFEEEKSTSKMK